MMQLLWSLLVASFIGTVVWLMQMSVRRFTQKVFSQTWHYYAGLLPLFFLLGGSAAVNRIMQWLTDAAAAPLTGTVAEAEASMQVLPAERAASGLAWMNQRFAGLLPLENIQPAVLPALLVWGVGALIFLAVNVQRYRTFRRSLLQDIRECKSVKCPVKVIVSTKATTPMLIGLWKPMIVLPDARIGDKELAMILSHELVHLKRGDLLVKLAVLVANAVHWFNPAVYWFNRQIHLLCELSCDEQVVRDMDTESRRLYGETLISMLEYGVMRRNVVCTSSLCSTKENMKRRLVSLMKVKKNPKSIVALSLAAAVAVIGGGGLAAYAAESVVPSKAAPSRPMEGRNITVQLPDGTIQTYDKNGNLVTPEPKLNAAPQNAMDEKTQKKIEELMKQIDTYINKGMPAPQQYLDALNEAYGIQPHGTK